MSRIRALLVDLVPAVAALFALSVAAPRAGFLYHQHPGGEHAHVHGDSDSALAELLEDYWHERDHVHEHDHAHPGHHHDDLTPGQPGSARTALTRDDGPATGHWHQQDRFHRAVVAGAPFIAAVAPAGFAPQPAPARHAYLAALDLRARGPPPSPLS
jgi:hypothetical protein